MHIGTECSVTKPFQIRLVSGICNKLVFDLRVLVLACLTNSSLKYRGAHPCMHSKVKSRITMIVPDFTTGGAKGVFFSAFFKTPQTPGFSQV